MNEIYTIGWFGIAGANGRYSTKTHIVCNRKPVCGAKLRKDMEFQWCSALGGYAPECRNCCSNKINKNRLGKRYIK